MSNNSRNRHSTEANSRQHDFPDDSTDFLDSLMEDVMGTNENQQESTPAEPALDDSESGDNNTYFGESDNTTFSDDNNYDNDSERAQSDSEYTQVDNSEQSKPRRRIGLLNRFSSGARDKSPETGVKEEPEVEDEVSSKTEDESSKVTEDTNKKPSSGRRLPLLSRVTAAKAGEDSTPETEDVFVEPVNTPEIEENIFGEEDTSNDKHLNDDNFIKGKTPQTTQEIDDNEENYIEDSTGDSDLFDELLEDFAEDTEANDIEKTRKNAELDPEVEVPLEKPGMDEVVVTADGRTLADMLPGLRSGNKSINKVVSDIRSQEEIVEVQGKKFSDNRYTKHVDVIDKDIEEREKRVALSMKFLQRNAEFTEQEKIIMKNLGVTNDQLAKIMRSKELSNKEKNEILALGRYGAEKHFKGRRYRTTVGDTAMLEFLVKFKYANTRILRWISNEPQNRTWRKLNRLRNSGLVESKSIIGIPDLWGATPAGTAIAGYSLNPGLRPMPKIPTISSSMGVNYIAACLWFNTVNVLNLDDFPANNRIISLQDDGRDRVRGEMLVSELEIRSSLGKEINPSSTTMQTLGDERLYDVISENVRVSFEEWEAGGKVGDSPEFLLGNEYMWVLFPTSQLTLSYHVPDLVVKRDRGPNGEPRSIAVEMERYEKTNDRYDKIMLAYKLDEHLYEKVIWITPSARVARALEQAAEQVGFDRYTIIPIITESGVYDKQDIWMI